MEFLETLAVIFIGGAIGGLIFQLAVKSENKRKR